MTRGTLDSRLAQVRDSILAMGSEVEQAVLRAVRSLRERDSSLAREVIAHDQVINELELKIEEDCLKLLALEQPLGSDLRLVGATLKICTDLERMADHAVEIAKMTLRFEGQSLVKPLVDIPKMAELFQQMLQQAMQAYANRDAAQARAMTKLDHEVDKLYREVFRELLGYMVGDQQQSEQAMYLLLVAQSLERAADHCTNLGEWTIYAATGEKPELND